MGNGQLRTNSRHKNGLNELVWHSFAPDVVHVQGLEQGFQANRFKLNRLFVIVIGILGVIFVFVIIVNVISFVLVLFIFLFVFLV